MFGPKIEPIAKKEWSHSVFPPLRLAGVSAVQRGHLPERRIFALQTEVCSRSRATRLCHAISPEISASRHIFLKNAASANIIL
jgi:hypothetical protein